MSIEAYYEHNRQQLVLDVALFLESVARAKSSFHLALRGTADTTQLYPEVLEAMKAGKPSLIPGQRDLFVSARLFRTALTKEEEAEVCTLLDANGLSCKFFDQSSAIKDEVVKKMVQEHGDGFLLRRFLCFSVEKSKS